MKFIAREWLWFVAVVIGSALFGIAINAAEPGVLAFFIGYPAVTVVRVTFWAIRVTFAPAIAAASEAARDSWRASAPTTPSRPSSMPG